MSQKEKYDLISEGSSQLEQLRSERQDLSSSIYDGLDKAEQLYNNMDLDSLAEAGVEMSKLDAGLSEYGGYKNTIADLASGLTGNLEEYVEFAAKGKNYQGVEKFVKMFASKKANRMRDTRLRNQSPKENLQQILSYSEQLVREIVEVREGALQTYDRLRSNGNVITRKIADYQPQEEALKEKLDLMDSEYAQMKEEFRTADARTQVDLTSQMDSYHADLSEVRHEHGQVLTIYNQAQQALAGNVASRDSFDKMVQDLGRQATMIKEKMDNVTEIYAAAPEAVKVMMTTKGMESLDKSLNVATTESVDIITQAASAVSDATLAREEIKLIDPEVMRGFMMRTEETMRDFNERYDAVRDDARKSEQEKYNL